MLLYTVKTLLYFQSDAITAIYPPNGKEIHFNEFSPSVFNKSTSAVNFNRLKTT